MEIQAFVAQSVGRWRSQRSSHNLAFQHSEEVHSVIDITAVSATDASVAGLCEAHGIDLITVVSPFHMAWEGESDWNEDEKLSGSCLLVPIPDALNRNQGKLLRSAGYAETVPAVGDYHFTEEGMFVLVTAYDRAAAEERIWFGTPNLLFGVSKIRTCAVKGVLTANFAS